MKGIIKGLHSRSDKYTKVHNHNTLKTEIIRGIKYSIVISLAWFILDIFITKLLLKDEVLMSIIKECVRQVNNSDVGFKEVYITMNLTNFWLSELALIMMQSFWLVEHKIKRITSEKKQ